jgi:signal transduction histidine kinase
LASEQEKEVLKRMDATYAAYLQRAQDLHTLMSGGGKSSASLADYNSVVELLRRLLDLGEELGRAHYAIRARLLAEAGRTLLDLRMAVLGLVGLLFAFGLALAAVVYRDLIAPLRGKLVASEALAQRNEKLASLGLLAAGVAHEIRNPLTAIKTALFLQQKKLPEGSPGRGDTELIEREVTRLERIVNEFLRFARPAKPEPVVMAAELPLKNVQALLAPQLAEADIRLIREEVPPLQLKADPGQLQQVLINLVQNGADSIGQGGIVTLRAYAARKPLADGETDVVVLEVADTGKGIPPEIEARLFDPFFTTKEQGTGLGLSIAARIMEMNGGTLQYQTKLDHGTTFGVVLPRVLPA